MLEEHRSRDSLSSAILIAFLSMVVASGFWTNRLWAQSDKGGLETKVMKIFEDNCTTAGCHTGTAPMMGLKLTTDEYYARTIDQPSTEKPQLMRIKPGEPDSSYLVMKILGTPGIIGSRMPFGRDPLTDDEITAIVGWVTGLHEVDAARLEEKKRDQVLPLNGWKVVNTPTSRMVDKGDWLFLISHRFFPPVNEGYDAFWGLDGSGIIFLNLGYAITNNLFVNLGRSNSSDNVQLDIKYGLKQQYPGEKLPFAAAGQMSLNWISEKSGDKDRFRSEAFKLSFQGILSSRLVEGVGVNVVPAILLNQDSNTDGEDPLFTIGLGGRTHVWRSISVIGEWVPIVSGYTLTSTFGEFNRFDSWGGGIELDVGGHVFQIIITNSAGLTADQYMRGGGLDITEGDYRLGFNIFRPLQF
jgi:Membrane bound beta barrel domain (DUF5777)